MTLTSSMTAAQFWQELKTEGDAVAWNLRDVLRNGGVGVAKPSLDRALKSSERIVEMITGRMEDFKRQIVRGRFYKGTRI